MRRTWSRASCRPAAVVALARSQSETASACHSGAKVSFPPPSRSIDRRCIGVLSSRAQVTAKATFACVDLTTARSATAALNGVAAWRSCAVMITNWSQKIVGLGDVPRRAGVSAQLSARAFGLYRTASPSPRTLRICTPFDSRPFGAQAQSALFGDAFARRGESRRRLLPPTLPSAAALPPFRGGRAFGAERERTRTAMCVCAGGCHDAKVSANPRAWPPLALTLQPPSLVCMSASSGPVRTLCERCIAKDQRDSHTVGSKRLGRSPQCAQTPPRRTLQRTPDRWERAAGAFVERTFTKAGFASILGVHPHTLQFYTQHTARWK